MIRDIFILLYFCRQSRSHEINDIYRYVLVDIFDRDVWLIYRSQHAEPHPYTLRKSMVPGSGGKNTIRAERLLDDTSSCRRRISTACYNT